MIIFCLQLQNSQTMLRSAEIIKHNKLLSTKNRKKEGKNNPEQGLEENKRPADTQDTLSCYTLKGAN